MISLGWCAIGFAQSEPQPFTPDTNAQPISATDAGSNGVLRWQSKPQASVSDYVASDASAQSIDGNSQVTERHGGRSVQNSQSRPGWNITRIDPNVKAAQYAAADPFHDPFGDRKPKAEPELILQPTQAESSVEELPAPRRFAPVRRAVPSDEPTMTVVRQPGGARSTPGSSVQPPFGAEPFSRDSIPSAPCNHIYNERNCCDKETECIAFRNRLLSDSIRNISLDITPRYNPDLTLEEDEADRADKLRQLETRTWINRRGATIATGKMISLNNGSVVIVDDSGKKQRLPINELGEDSLCYITAWWRLPSECPLGGLRTQERNWLCSTFYYGASAICHKPLYFEEVQLERYGHTAGPVRQPIISGCHFVMNLAILPYRMGINPPTECQYALGYYRPGSCAPWMIPPFPLSVRGAATEALAAAGIIAILP